MSISAPTPSLSRRSFVATALLLLVFGFTACGGEAQDKSAPQAAGSPKAAAPVVLATTLPLYDFARTVAGSDARVELLPPPGIGIHGYSASLKDRERLSRANIVIANGLGLESWLDSDFEAELKTRGVQIVRTGDAIPHSELRNFGDESWWNGMEDAPVVIETLASTPSPQPVSAKPAGLAPVRKASRSAPASKPVGHTSECGCADCAVAAAAEVAASHESDCGCPSCAAAAKAAAQAVADGACPVCGGFHGAKDVHVWLWRRGMEVQIDQIESALAKLIPEQAQAFASRASKLKADLAAVYEDGRQRLSSHRGRGMITFHDAWAYFGKDMGIRVVGVVTPVPGVGGSLKNREQLESLMRSGRACAVFMEPRMDPMFATQVADAVGAKVYMLDPMESTADLAGFSVIDAMRANIAALETAFGE